MLLGVEKHWHLPLLFCRALSTAPAAWWGLRCAFTFLGELLLDESGQDIEAPWSVEKRFRVTEVFLAVLWVWRFRSRIYGQSEDKCAWIHNQKIGLILKVLLVCMAKLLFYGLLDVSVVSAKLLACPLLSSCRDI